MVSVGAYSDRSINSQEALLARVDLGRYAGWIRTDLYHLLLEACVSVWFFVITRD